MCLCVHVEYGLPIVCPNLCYLRQSLWTESQLISVVTLHVRLETDTKCNSFFVCLFNTPIFFLSLFSFKSTHMKLACTPKTHTASVSLFSVHHCGSSYEWGPWHGSLFVRAPSSVIWRTESQQYFFIFWASKTAQLLFVFAIFVCYW